MKDAGRVIIPSAMTRRRVGAERKNAHGVQIGHIPWAQSVDAIVSIRNSLDMQRLGDIADKLILRLSKIRINSQVRKATDMI